MYTKYFPGYVTATPAAHAGLFLMMAPKQTAVVIAWGCIGNLDHFGGVQSENEPKQMDMWTL